MTNEFGQRVYPVIRHVFDVLAKIRKTGGNGPDPQDVSSQLRRLLAQFDVQGPRATEFQLAKSALVYWIDEVLVHSNWEHAGYWSDHCLERTYFSSRERAWRFFDNAESARSMDSLDALETYYLCACFGFKGIYRDSSGSVGSDTSSKTADDTWTAEDEADAPAQPAEAEEESSQSMGDNWWDAQGDAMKTWGIGGDEITESIEEFMSGRAGPSAPPPKRMKATQMASLEEWVESVCRQLASAPQLPYAPASPASELGDATPLSGRTARSYAMLTTVMASILLLVLWIAFLNRM
ncbi:MAG: DotU family type IV/VI secretion system protein [Maioricimonas sp. JB045]